MENKFCSKCGAQLTDTDVFCSKCGFKIDEAESVENLSIQNTTSGEKIKKKGNVCSLLAIIFGAIGIIPLLNFLFLPPAIILAIIGLIICKNRKKGITIASIIVVILSLVVSFSWIAPSNNSSKSSNENKETSTVVSQPEEQYENISFPETVKTDCFEIYFDKVLISKEIRPKRTSGYYNYKSADDGKQYCYIKGTIKNISGSSHEISISGDFVFDDTYEYTGIMLKDVKNGVDIVYLGETIQPLETIDFYYACSVPNEMLNTYKSAEVKLDMSTDLWDSSVDTLYNKYCLSFSR